MFFPLCSQFSDVVCTQCCKGKGFFCEVCDNDEVIFAFQLREVTKCKICKALFHSQCFKKVKGKCPKVCT